MKKQVKNHFRLNFLFKSSFTLFISCLLLAVVGPYQAQATVFEYTQNGDVVVSEAYDFASFHRTQKKKIRPQHIKTHIKDVIEDVGGLYGVSAQLIDAVIRAESSYNPGAISSKGAIGLMQVMPDTAKDYGVSDLLSINNNIKAGTRHLKYLLDYYRGDLELVLAAYNAGQGSVDKYGGIPPYKETKDYVRKVISFLDKENE